MEFFSLGSDIGSYSTFPRKNIGMKKKKKKKNRSCLTASKAIDIILQMNTLFEFGAWFENKILYFTS
jgi:hypothetical protein